MIRRAENTSDRHTRCRNDRAASTPGRRWLPLWHLAVGLISLVWFVLRVGTKPSRIQYPCQRVAAPLASGFVIYLAGMLSSVFVYSRYRTLIRKMSRRAALACLCLGAFAVVAFLGVRVKDALGISDPVHTHPPIGAGTPTVVSVYDENATNWSGQSYYWNYVNQSTVNTMMTRAITALTGTATTNQAWLDILPSYSSGDTIAIKVNFNNEGDATDLNSLPQPVIALINQLKLFGFAESDITVYDTSRRIGHASTNSIHYFFRNLIESTFPGVAIVDKDTPNRLSTNQFSTYSTIDGIVSTPYARILDDVDYLINMPIMRAHGGAGITLGFKNHYGSIERITFGGGVEPLHDGLGLTHPGYSDTGVPMVELNSLSVIRNKTVLVVGDGIYSHSYSNTQPPNLNPEVILMSKDPVAADSVMFDYLHTLNGRSAYMQNYLHLAAEAGLGVHDHYPYTRINYVELDADTDVYALTVNVVGSGSVNRNPAPPYYLDDEVTLTAIADTGWEFSGWSGAVTGSSNPTSVTMDSHKSVTATFTEIPPDPQVHISAARFVEEGDTLSMTAVVRYLDGTIEYQWSKAGVGNLPGETGPSMTIDPVAESDQGYYQVEVWVGAGDHILSPLRFVDVVPVGTIPVTGSLGLGALIGACALAGAAAVRRKNR